MFIDENIAREFVKGDITAKAFRSYLVLQLQKPQNLSHSVEEYNFAEKIDRILGCENINNMQIDNWEQVFLLDNQGNENPSENQANRLEKLWRRYKRMVGE